jgi:Domain of unknown function (DUF4845)
VKLPLWRLVLAVLVLGVMVTVLLSLMPVYFENYQLGQFVKQLMRGPTSPDDTLRAAVLKRARELDLPVETSDVTITHSEGKTEIKTKYKVQMDFLLYQVDLHLPANVASR